MTGHAGPGRGDAGRRQLLGLCVTIAAVEPEFGRMMLVAEGDGLFAGDPDAGREIRPREGRCREDDADETGHDEHESEAEDRIGARREELPPRRSPHPAIPKRCL